MSRFDLISRSFRLAHQLDTAKVGSDHYFSLLEELESVSNELIDQRALHVEHYSDQQWNRQCEPAE